MQQIVVNKKLEVLVEDIKFSAIPVDQNWNSCIDDSAHNRDWRNFYIKQLIIQYTELNHQEKDSLALNFGVK